MFTMEQEEYKREHISWEQIKFIDNQVTIDLIEHPRQASLFKILDEECMIKGSDTGLIKKYYGMLEANRSFGRIQKYNATSFIVKHYAGDVEYETAGFLEKNKDSINDSLIEGLKTSKSSLIQTVLAQDPPPEEPAK